MPRYVVLAKMTQQGLQAAKDLPQRRERAKAVGKSLGITFRDWHLTMGQYDIVIVVDGPNDEAMATFALQIGGWGTISTQTLRAFSEAEADTLAASL